MLVHESSLPCRAILAFPSGESFAVAPATPWLANTAGGSGFPAGTQRSQKTANQENPQACKSRLDFVCFQTHCRFFTSCSYRCYCGLNRKLHTSGDGRAVWIGKGRLFSEVREYPAASCGCEEFSGNDLGVSASQKPWQPAFVLIK